MKIKPFWLALTGYMVWSFLVFGVLRWSFETKVTELPVSYWLVLAGALLAFAIATVIQVLNNTVLVKFSPTFWLFTIALSLLFILAPFIFPLPAYGWSGTGYITGGMVATASFGVSATLLELWIYRRGRTAAIALPRID
ncbi:MAG TPA: hypothetical protein VGE45_12035 [Chloroflexia bacterium]|jgi:hypothetical protein